uniref:26S proteasome regulatory subunit 8 homolog n=1 Tax=Dermatophagoides pteronyssinus TaxID=6956 RepID=A0A6P6YBP5_DERPT|nr:26S proteasome regulatory subunit 8 homolog [Dermatophagoides pteronyssinus]
MAECTVLSDYYDGQIDLYQKEIYQIKHENKRFEAERDKLNKRVRELKSELEGLLESAYPVGEVIKPLGKTRVLVRLNSDGRYVVELGPNIKIEDCKLNTRVALSSDSYVIHKILPNSVDPLVSLMKVEKVPDSCYADIGGLSKQIKAIKEVIELPINHPELFEQLGMFALRERRVNITQTDFELAVAKVMKQSKSQNASVQMLLR